MTRCPLEVELIRIVTRTLAHIVLIEGLFKYHRRIHTLCLVMEEQYGTLIERINHLRLGGRIRLRKSRNRLLNNMVDMGTRRLRLIFTQK